MDNFKSQNHSNIPISAINFYRKFNYGENGRTPMNLFNFQ